MVGLMLLDGLRSCEIMTLKLEDLKLADALPVLHVLGKGNKPRTLPLPGEIMEGPPKLPSPGTTRHCFSFSVCVVKRPAARPADHACRPSLTVPPSPP